MKNLNLLRLAGFGFFGAVFLSPSAPGQPEDWLLEKLNVAKRLTCLPFTSSAIYRENYLTEPKATLVPLNSMARPNFFLSSLYSGDPPIDSIPGMLPAYDSLAPYPTPIQTDPANDLMVEQTTAIADRIFPYAKTNSPQSKLVTKSSLSGDAEPINPTDQTNTAENSEIIEYTARTTGMYLPENIPGEQSPEEVLPPTEYIDEAIIGIAPAPAKVKVSALVPIITTKPEAGLETYPIGLMKARIRALTAYAIENNYSTDYAFLINMGLKSGKKRFFLVDLRTGSILNSGLVAHGRGKEKFTLSKRYSNMFGSSCSSLGLYKIGSAYTGDFGKSFRLIGLQKTNNNALSRAIVLHAMSCIPNEEIDYPICQSEGCPSLSPELLESISPVIKKSAKPLLLWIFDPVIDRDQLPY